MNTTTLITGAGALTGTGLSLFDVKKKEIKKNNAEAVLGTALTLTATTAVGATLENHGMNQIHEKYSSAYVESMSDEELEKALMQMDLLLADNPEEKDVKTF